MTDDNAEYRHLLGKCRDAHNGGWGVLSTGEKLAAALVLNRPNWLATMGYTMAEAVDRVGPTWCSMLLQVQRELYADAAKQLQEPSDHA